MHLVRTAPKRFLKIKRFRRTLKSSKALQPPFLPNLLRLIPYSLRSPAGLRNHQPPDAVATSTLLMSSLPPRPSIGKLMSLPTYFLVSAWVSFARFEFWEPLFPICEVVCVAGFHSLFDGRADWWCRNTIPLGNAQKLVVTQGKAKEGICHSGGRRNEVEKRKRGVGGVVLYWSSSSNRFGFYLCLYFMGWNTWP
ncbi:unnamed protein product [Lactuca virosa]|uniref:Uncharacterized protein n=1 Tax=Lactuca virosa TaxID=75947 RepID=A0AAU9PB45_9ASTR|nr:unnamed protein product [Lactuca virosa]